LGYEQPELKLAVRGDDAALVLLPLECEGQQEYGKRECHSLTVAVL
jgi:hypothetical protein